MLPAVELLGFVRVWLIVEPDEALAPVRDPVFVPRVHAKLLAADDVRLMLGPVPLQIVALADPVYSGVGFTVTVMAVFGPAHDPATEVGITL